MMTYLFNLKRPTYQSPRMGILRALQNMRRP